MNLKKIVAYLSAGILFISANTFGNEIDDIKIKRQFIEDGEIIVLNDFLKNNFQVDRENNTIHIGVIDDKVIGLLEQEAFVFDLLGKKNITLDFHSPGGSLDAMHAIIIQLQRMKQQGFHITTKVGENNACMSACTLLFLQGDVRIAHSKSIIMIHSPYWKSNQRLPWSLRQHYNNELQLDRMKFIYFLEQVCPQNGKLSQDILDQKDHYYTSTGVNESCPGFITDFEDIQEETQVESVSN